MGQRADRTPVMDGVQLWGAAATAAAPALRLLLRLRARRGKEIAARLDERRGIEAGARPGGRLLWLHAASVGETVSVLPVLQAVIARAPAARILLTTGTVTSARLLASRSTELGLDGRVMHRFAPLDVPRWVARFLDHWRPDAAALIESELWPNLIAACRARGVPVMLLNARMSPRSFRRWRRVPAIARGLLAGFARIEAQSAADADRLRALGGRSVHVGGNLKFAADPLPVVAGELDRLRALLAGRPVWLAASTHPGEEALVCAAHGLVAVGRPGLLTVIAPRHPERGARIAAEIGGIAVARRGAGEDPPAGAGVWIADTLGELGLLYRLAPAAFLGRSLLPPGGGQNPLEAARLGCAVCVGPHTLNFAEIVPVLRDAGALTEVCDATTLAAWVGAMLDDPVRCTSAGHAGRAAAARYADLPDRLADTLLSLAAPT